jgi:hypothetical protein
MEFEDCISLETVLKEAIDQYGSKRGSTRNLHQYPFKCAPTEIRFSTLENYIDVSGIKRYIPNLRIIETDCMNFITNSPLIPYINEIEMEVSGPLNMNQWSRLRYLKIGASDEAFTYTNTNNGVQRTYDSFTVDLSHLVNLEKLEINDILVTGLDNMTKLVEMNACNPQDDFDVGVLKFPVIPSLKKLKLINYGFSNLNNLESLTELYISQSEDVDSESNSITHDISKLVNLKKLTIIGTFIDDITTLVNVETLKISRMSATDISTMTNLTELNCDGTEFLEKISNTLLITLSCNGSSVNDISEARELRELYCRSSNITDISNNTKLEIIEVTILLYNQLENLKYLRTIKCNSLYCTKNNLNNTYKSLNSDRLLTVELIKPYQHPGSHLYVYIKGEKYYMDKSCSEEYLVQDEVDKIGDEFQFEASWINVVENRKYKIRVDRMIKSWSS